MTHEYFSDRECGTRPQNSEEIDKNAWGGLKAAVKKRINDDSFASEFPIVCEEFDGGTVKTDSRSFYDALYAEVNDRETGLPIDMSDGLPSTFTILEMLEFCHRVVAAPAKEERRHDSYSGFYTHDHVLRSDKQRGQEKFRKEVNTIFRRNGIAFELTESGRVERTLPPVLGDIVRDTTFQTGDKGLDEYLDRARTKFLHPDPAAPIREPLEPLWDAWDRLKSIECPGDKKKKQSINALLARAAACPFRGHLDTEARELTCIGNKFMIRHSETDKIPLDEPHHVDYLFYRLFAMIHMLLVASGRM